MMDSKEAGTSTSNGSGRSDKSATLNASRGDYMKRETSWPSVLFLIHLYILGLYGIFILFTNTSLLTAVFTFTLVGLGILGATAGAHRLWTHQTYKATTTLRVFLMLCQTIAGQGSIYNWAQAHLLHHKTFRTDQDPFYSNRNFLAAHVLSQVNGYTDEQKELLKTIDMSHLENDKVVMFQKRFYWLLYIMLHVLLPVNAPLEYWGDSVAAALFVTFSLRYFIVLNVCWLINSAHFVWGLDKNFKVSDSNSIFVITKSYWPQYHYLLPNDYQSGEFGDYSNGTITAIIRVFAALDMAHDLHTISSVTVRTGLTKAVETGRPIVDCIKEEAEKDAKLMPKNHFLNRNRFL